LEQAEIWYKKAHMRENQLKNFMHIIAQETGIELSNRKITNQSGRKTLIQSLKDMGKFDYEVMTNSKHKTIRGMISYERPKDNLQMKNISDLYSAIASNNQLAQSNQVIQNSQFTQINQITQNDQTTQNNQITQNDQTMQGFKNASDLLK
ncbi:18602_t:CDS:1, partial [Racocetra fulgida]